jgi:hypothetical protein
MFVERPGANVIKLFLAVRCLTRIDSGLTCKHYTRLEKLARDKHYSLLQKLVTHGPKKFYNFGSRAHLSGASYGGVPCRVGSYSKLQILD